MPARVIFDGETRKWFHSHPGAQTTVCQCTVCYKYYKPYMGHKCKKGGAK